MAAIDTSFFIIKIIDFFLMSKAQTPSRNLFTPQEFKMGVMVRKHLADAAVSG